MIFFFFRNNPFCAPLKLSKTFWLSWVRIYCKHCYSRKVWALTPLHLDPLGLHGGYVKPLLGVDLPDVIAGS